MGDSLWAAAVNWTWLARREREKRSYSNGRATSFIAGRRLIWAASEHRNFRGGRFRVGPVQFFLGLPLCAFTVAVISGIRGKRIRGAIMAWQQSPTGKRYYYRSVKKDGRVIHTYCGTGEAGEKAAAEDEQRRQARRQHLEAQHSIEAQWKAIWASAQTLTESTTQLTRATLVLAGFHQHRRGEWRRRRHVEHTDTPPTR